MLSRSKCATKMFSARTPRDAMSDHSNYNGFASKSAAISKVWIASLVFCFLICAILISLAVWVVAMTRDKPLEQSKALGYESSIQETNDNFLDDIIEHPPNHDDHMMNDSVENKDQTSLLDNLNSSIEKLKLFIHSETTTTPEPSIQPEYKAPTKKPKISLIVQKERLKNHKLSYESTTPSQSSPTTVNKVLISAVVNTTSVLNATKNAYERTQISSPEGPVVTANLADLIREKDYSLSPEYDTDLVHPDSNIKKKDNPEITKVNESSDPIRDGMKQVENHISGFLNMFGAKDQEVYPDDYFYSEADAQIFYYDYGKVSWSSYLLTKVQELYDWIVTDLPAENGKQSKGNENAPLPQILKALNYTIIQGDVSILLMKLRDLYAKETFNFDAEKSRKMLTNTTSLVSFGFLALDIILLRNIQLMAWDSQEKAESEMKNDLEIFAFNSIFMNPDQVKSIYNEMNAQSPKSVHVRSNNNVVVEETTEDQSDTVSMAEELIQFATSTFRAMINLGQAFRNARSEEEKERQQRKTFLRRRIDANKPAGLDCIWTLYCKNLNKATNLEGPYGIIAKLNSIGLRLILGELKIEKTIETFVEETLTESRLLSCDKIFSKCNSKDAPKVVLEKVLGIN